MSDPLPALQALSDHFGEMRDAMRRYLAPDSGIAAEQFAAEIIELLDGPRRREVQALVEAALGQAQDGLGEFPLTGPGGPGEPK
jgi:hypothetical protein